MVSTYLSYDLVTRDLKATLSRTASDAQIAREAAYYKEHIGEVKNVDEFLDDYRLYAYAMKAHGLEDMTYAKAFMKKVLESDLSDENSYANKLSDDRYRNFATAYQFNGTALDAQSDAQESAVFGLYKSAQGTESASIKEQTTNYHTVIDTVTSAQDLVNRPTMMNYLLKAYEINGEFYTKEHFVKVLTSDVSDPNSYVNQLVAKDAADTKYDLHSAEFLALAKAFNFNADGSLVNATAQTAAQKDNTESLYIDNTSTYVSEFSRQREQAYFESKMATITNISQLTGDSRLFEYVKAAFQMPSTTLKATFTNIVTDRAYANQLGGTKYTSIFDMFHFELDGTVTSGFAAQDAAQAAKTKSAYTNHFDDADIADMQTLLDYYSSAVTKISTVDDLLKNSSVRIILFKAFNIKEGDISDANLKKALKSNLDDPNSYASKSKDERIKNLARAFNFDSDGDATAPLMAQNEITITSVAKSYIVNMTRYLKDDELKAAKTKAADESTYYQEHIKALTSAKEFLKDRRLVDFVLKAAGFEPKDVTDDFMKQLFSSDLADPKSFANQQTDARYAELVASFNFDSEGLLTHTTVGTVQQRGAVLATQNLYLHQMLEEDQGNSNAGVRLALYFERIAPTLTDAYDLLGDTALLETFRVTFGYSADFSNMDIDMQKKLVDKNLNLSDLQDPAKMKKFLSRFTAMYDTESGGYSSSALTVLTGGGGINADLLMSLSQLKAG